jgi:4'-phosphopantetheinyl transferase
VTASLWLLDLRPIAFDAMRALLSAEEHARAQRYKVRGDVERFVKSRGALRRILGTQTDLDGRALVILEGGGRKPELRDHPSLHFNLSHSGDYALIAVGSQPLGVDIEAIRLDVDWHALAKMNFHPDERAILEARPDAAIRTFFQIWAHKEAFLKAIGIGFTDQLTSIAVPLEGGMISAPKFLSPRSWHATPLDSPPGYAASIVSGTRPTLRRVTTSLAV